MKREKEQEQSPGQREEEETAKEAGKGGRKELGTNEIPAAKW